MDRLGPGESNHPARQPQLLRKFETTASRNPTGNIENTHAQDIIQVQSGELVNRLLAQANQDLTQQNHPTSYFQELMAGSARRIVEMIYGAQRGTQEPSASPSALPDQTQDLGSSALPDHPTPTETRETNNGSGGQETTGSDKGKEREELSPDQELQEQIESLSTPSITVTGADEVGGRSSSYQDLRRQRKEQGESPGSRPELSEEDRLAIMQDALRTRALLTIRTLDETDKILDAYKKNSDL